MVWPDTLPDTAAEELLTHLQNKRDAKPGADSAKLKHPKTETHPAGVIEVSKFNLVPEKEAVLWGIVLDKSRLPLGTLGERGVKMAIDYAVDNIATELVLEGNVTALTSNQYRAKVVGHIRRRLYVDAPELMKTDFGLELSLAVHRKIIEQSATTASHEQSVIQVLEKQLDKTRESNLQALVSIKITISNFGG